jgi:hypothetical protein
LSRILRGPAVTPLPNGTPPFSVPNIPENLRETAYWVALEVAAADRVTRPEEIRFLDMLRDALELDRSTTTQSNGASAPVT